MTEIIRESHFLGKYIYPAEFDPVLFVNIISVAKPVIWQFEHRK